MNRNILRRALLVTAAALASAALGAQLPRFDVSYEYSADGTRGTKTVQPGPNAGFTFVSRPGGCGLNDIAECQVNSAGDVIAFQRDSCDPKGAWGQPVRAGGQCSAATSRGFVVRCCKNAGPPALVPDPFYLSDSRALLIQESNVHGGLQFNRVYWQPEVWIAGVRYQRALGMHAPIGIGFADFRIPAGAKSFRSTFGLARQDTAPALGEAAGRIYIDNQRIWQATVSSASQTANVQIQIPAGAKTLRLEVDSLGPQGSDHTTWADPRFMGR